MITAVFLAMIAVQSGAYLWFQSKGGVVSHKKYMIANALFMVGQTAQASESYIQSAWASFTIASFYFLMTALGIAQRYAMMRRGAPEDKA